MERINILLTDCKNIRADYEGKIKQLITGVLPKWNHVCLGDNRLELGFKDGVWKPSGNDRFQTLDIYYGYEDSYDFKNKTYKTEFRYQMNIGAMGSFTMDDSGVEYSDQYVMYNYYTGISALLSNIGLKSDLRSLLTEYSDLIKPIKKEINSIQDSIEKEKQIKKAAEEKVQATIKFNEMCAAIKAMPNAYALLRKVCLAKTDIYHTYRKQPVEVLNVSENKSELYNCDEYKPYYGSEIIIKEVSKLKIAQ